jgi:hypothetical protein
VSAQYLQESRESEIENSNQAENEEKIRSADEVERGSGVCVCVCVKTLNERMRTDRSGGGIENSQSLPNGINERSLRVNEGQKTQTELILKS